MPRKNGICLLLFLKMCYSDDGIGSWKTCIACL